MRARRVAMQAALALLLAQAAGAQALPAPAAPPPDSARGVAVLLDGRPILELRAPIGRLSPAERAAVATARLERISRRVGPDAIPVRLDSVESFRLLVVGTEPVLTLTPADADSAGVPLDSLAGAWVTALRQGLAVAHEPFTLLHLARRAGLAALVTLLLLLVLRGLGWLAARADAALHAARGRWIRRVGIQKLELLSEDRLLALLGTAVRVLRFAASAVAVYAWLTTVLGLFPWTEALAPRLLEFVVRPLRLVGSGLVGYLPELAVLVVIVLVTRWLLHFVRLLFDEIERGRLVLKGFDPEWGEPTYKLVRIAVVAFAAVVAFPYLPGSDSDAFKGVSIFLGVLVSFGSGSSVANVMAGVFLTYTGAFRIGDRVRIGEVEGDVESRSLLVTRVRTIKNVVVTVPNSLVLGTHVHNFSERARKRQLILHTTVTIGYDAPWRTVHELLVSAARKTPTIVEDPAPFVLQTSLDDFYVSYQLNAYTDNATVMVDTYSALHQNIQDAFNAAGVEIMSPHYRQLRDGNTVTIPAEHRAPGYRAPAFEVAVRPPEPPAR